MNTYDFQGRVAVITGGANGIGKAVSGRLAASDARVAIWDLDLDAAEGVVAGTGGLACRVDVTDMATIDAAMAETEARLGPVSILVNSAGVAGPNHPLADYPPAAWKTVLDVNLLGTFHVNRAVIPGMLARDYGRIVNIASVAGKEGNPNASAYSASKAGVIALTKSLGKEVAHRNIAVNCVTPAAARTAIFDQMSEEHIAFMLSKIPRGRFLALEEIAGMIAWLVSEENSFTTGAAFDLSGGRATY